MLILSPKDLALAIADRRKKLKLSQAEVSNLVGLKQKTISAIENRPESIQLNTLFRVLSALYLDLQLLPKNPAENPNYLNNRQWKEEW